MCGDSYELSFGVIVFFGTCCKFALSSRGGLNAEKVIITEMPSVGGFESRNRKDKIYVYIINK